MSGLLAVNARAQEPIRIGVVLPMTGPARSVGDQTIAGIRLFVQEHGEIVAGRRIELLLRDDAGLADSTRRRAQELVVRDHVVVLAGFGQTPGALATAPIATQAEVPMVVMVAATSSVTAESPFIVRTGQVIPQSAVALADWALSQGNRHVVSLVSDYGPGLDAETWFARRFAAGGGSVAESLRAPLISPNFSPFLQRAADARPQALFAYVPSDLGAIFARQFAERGLDRSGIPLIAVGGVTDDEQLNAMGDAALGIVMAGPYSAAHDSPENRHFLAAFQAANPGRRPNYNAVFGYDGMRLIIAALEATGGNGDGTAMVAAMTGMHWESPRGPMMIDPATRDVVQNIYISRVARQNGELYNIEFATIPMMRDPAKP